jgi:hypothetical protein
MKVVSKNVFILSYYKNFMLSLQITKIMNIVGVPIFHLKLKYIITSCMSRYEIYGTLHIASHRICCLPSEGFPETPFVFYPWCL